MRLLALLAVIGVVGCGDGKVGPTGGGGTTGTGGSGNTGAGGSGNTGGQFTGSSGCALFTPDDVWNADVSGRAVNTTWTNAINSLLGAVNIHPDFGPGFGIPINVVPANQMPLPITFDNYPEESDAG